MQKSSQKIRLLFGRFEAKKDCFRDFLTFKDDVEMIIPARPPSLYQLVQLSQDQEESFDLDDGQWVPGQSASVNSVMTFIGFFKRNLVEI